MKIPQRHVKIVTGILKNYLILMRHIHKHKIACNI
jgi:hypothetical protein